MSIHFQVNIDGETTDEAIAEFRKVFGALLGDTPRTTAPLTGEVLDLAPKPARGRTKKDKEPETIEGTANPLPDASSAEKTESDSTASSAEKSDTSASSASSIPDLDTVRAKLKALGATDGLGHDKVFEVLGKYGAKNASTVPEDKRAELIAEIDTLLAGAK